MKTLREYIEILDEISRRDFLKGVGATAGLAATGAAKADWQKQADILHVGGEGNPVTNYKNTSSDGSAVLAAYTNPSSAGVTNTKGAWNQARRGVELSGAIKIDGGAPIAIEFHNMRPQTASIVAPGGVGGDAASQKIINAILNAKQSIVMDARDLGGGILQFSSNGIREDEELDEAGTPDAVKRIEQLVQYK